MLGDVQRLRADTAQVAGSAMWSLSDDELIPCLREAYLLVQVALLIVVRLVQVACGRGVPGTQGHRTAAGWLRSQLLIDHGPARELADRATALVNRPNVEQALLDGALDLRQAGAVADALEAIPGDLAVVGEDGEPVPDGALIADQAEAFLIEKAAHFPAEQLRRLGERILTHVAPEIAERVEAAALRRQEARAHAKRGFTLTRPYEGVVRVSGSFTVEDAETVTAAIEPLCAPLPEDDRLPAQRRADALVDVCRLAMKGGDLPDSGGEPAQVMVTIPFDPIAGLLGAGITDGGDRISAATARRLACNARIVPVVLGGKSQILDVGRACRLATAPIRRALAVRDGGCAFPGCDRPPRWCDAHHLHPWSAGGVTSLDNLVLVCRHHHRALHEPALGWAARLGADRLPEFIPPVWVDPAQAPRHNLYHPRK
ncbi:HNH endonuclease signature motif containing protein [Paractinoplanes rishiriensis]|uniref:HNH endonuclease n=1 Tax=Paractinoplanes rishiriensis TaxID=1050105 RepID=A0A919JUA6_9ACTN|nr:HNH endonuclease signature motif containing protein [Actinoplanes rishiriensis]GIE93409.1 HNH endonuclease [Actinoplanes rishiriensis]